MTVATTLPRVTGITARATASEDPLVLRQTADAGRMSACPWGEGGRNLQSHHPETERSVIFLRAQVIEIFYRYAWTDSPPHRNSRTQKNG